MYHHLTVIWWTIYGRGGGWNHQSEDKFVSLKGAGNEAAGRDELLLRAGVIPCSYKCKTPSSKRT